jgi:hypothetical protein
MKATKMLTLSVREYELRKLVHAIANSRGWVSKSWLKEDEESEIGYEILCLKCRVRAKVPELREDTIYCSYCGARKFDELTNRKEFRQNNRITIAPTTGELYYFHTWNINIKTFRRKIGKRREKNKSFLEKIKAMMKEEMVDVVTMGNGLRVRMPPSLVEKVFGTLENAANLLSVPSVSSKPKLMVSLDRL